MRTMHTKRKEPEETIVELFHNMSLSPLKQLHVKDLSMTTDSWPTPTFELEKKVQLTPPQVDLLNIGEVLTSSLLSPPRPPIHVVVNANHAIGGTKNKSIILYKPINSSPFPGGPPIG